MTKKKATAKKKAKKKYARARVKESPKVEPTKKPLRVEARESYIDPEADFEVTAREISVYLGIPQTKISSLINKYSLEPSSGNYTQYHYFFIEFVIRLIKELIEKTKSPPMTPLEERRVRALDIKNAKESQTWAPIESLEAVLSIHNQSIRSIIVNAVPKLRAKYSESIPIEALDELQKDLTGITEMICDLDLDESDFDLEEEEDVEDFI